MKKIGRVVHISPSGKAVIKAEKTPGIGVTVIDEKNRQVGKVFDIVGPTVSPYVLVDVKTGDPQSIVGSLLYFMPLLKQKKRNGRR
ncbi:hypothetical protein KEJ18_06285 [Candidatus Bathyarchaeota archaeon]|nr:hypothetical protein [Candidatus Bathyarchaeota archaeon]